MFTWVPLALLINAAFAAQSGLKGLSSYSSANLAAAPVVSTGEVVYGGSGLNAGSEIIGSSALTGAQGFGAELVSSGIGSGANVISSAPVYSSGVNFGVGHDASLLSAAAPAFSGAHFISSAPAYSGAQVIHTGYSTSGGAGAIVSRQSSASPGVIKNAYKTITEVEPGKEIVLRAQAKPQVHKQVELVAQVVKPKVEVTRVMAPPQVEHKVLVREQKPQIIRVVPQMHTTTIVKEAPKPKPQMFLSQKRRQTIAKKVEIDQHKITAITPEHGYEAGYNGGFAGNGAVVSTIGGIGGIGAIGGGHGIQGETIVTGNGMTGLTGGETIVTGNGMTGLTGGETIVAGDGMTGFNGGETIVAGNGMTGVSGETLVGGMQGETIIAGNAGNLGHETVVETSNSRPRFTFGKLGSESRLGTKI